MADAITIKALQDASLDAKSLEEVVNGDEAKQVTTRKGETYPSVKKAIKNLFENGGLPATPFATKALMTASALANNKYAMVTDDTAANNGMYVKTAGAWVKSEYDPVAKALKHTDDRLGAELTPFIKTAASEPVFLLLDENGVAAVSISSKGDVNLTHMEGSVQETIADLYKKLPPISTSASSDLVVLMDSNNMPVARVTNSGELYLTALEGSVQGIQESTNEMIESVVADIISNSEKQPYGKVLTDSYLEAPISAVFKDKLTGALLKYGSIAPLPKFIAKQDFAVNDTWLNSVNLTVLNASDRVPIKGYDPTLREDIGVVHPSVIAFNSKVAGYKYWMGINPYTGTNENIELPFIYGSNDDDLKTWELIPTFPQPFEADPIDKDGSYRGHLSDSAITYDPNTGDIVYIWRESLYYNSGGKSGIYDSIRASKFDGNNWSETYYLMNPTTERVMSPAIVFNEVENVFYLYYISGGFLKYKTSPDLSGSNWGETMSATFVGGTQNGNFWHVDAKNIGDKVVLLIHSDDAMSDVVDRFHFASSSDFKNFSLTANNIVTNEGAKIYKASFLPDLSADGTGKMSIIYTSDANHSEPWKLYVTKTNTINLGV